MGLGSCIGEKAVDDQTLPLTFSAFGLPSKDSSTKPFFISGLDPLRDGQHIILDSRRPLYELHI
jgi:hypothetical protein